ncbi:GGDEF domain-containing protein [Roseibium aquae]|uniref:diguanylate cyclase n=2 Tax=Roseibium aquae TaxID=1323746 RepID=A0A916TJ22_9HYPH|nr:GGDEF domain-containing protein [Roseibium aquae]
MKEHGLSCAPKVYHVLYATLIARDKRIAAAFDRLVSQGMITDTALEFLFDTYLFGELDGSQRDEIIETTQMRTRTLTGFVKRSHTSAVDLASRPSATPTHQELARDLSEAMEEAKRLERDILALQRQLMTDPLTGIPNRRFFELELAGAIRQGRSDAFVAFLDVDHFKAINDTHGHAIGDQVLKLIAGRLASKVERPDVLSRYGGEEFAALLFRSDMSACLNAIETLRTEISAQQIRNSRTGKMIGRITLSAGITAVGPADELQEVMRRADGLLYKAKSEGRDRVRHQGLSGQD